MKKLAIFSALLGGVASCVTMPDAASTTRTQFAALLKSGDAVGALEAVRNSSASPSDLSPLVKDTTFLATYRTQASTVGCHASGDNVAPRMMLAQADALSRLGATSAEETGELRTSALERYRSCVAGNDIKASISDGLDLLSTQTTKLQNIAVLQNTVGQGRGSISSANAEALIRFVSESKFTSALDPMMRKAINSGAFSREALEGPLHARYATDTARALDNMTHEIFIAAGPKQKLLALDLGQKLSQDPAFRVVDSRSAAEAVISIEELGYSFHENQPVTQTVRYDKYQVDLVQAILSMPDYSTYQYEQTVSAAQLDYAYEVGVIVGGKKADQKIVRGKDEKRVSFCTSPRIVNVFGGTFAAGFTANADMSSRCGGQATAVSENDLREDIVEKLASEIEGMAPFASH